MCDHVYSYSMCVSVDFPNGLCTCVRFCFSLPRDTVAKKCEHDEEDGECHALVDSTLRLDAIVHHHVPVLASQDLNTHTHKNNQMRPHLTGDD